MKISKKLQDRIKVAIRTPMEDFRKLLDEFDRTDQISHEQWQKLHRTAIEAERQSEEKAIRTIEAYSR